MSSEEGEPPTKRRLLVSGESVASGPSVDCNVSDSITRLHESIETCFIQGCLCPVQDDELETYIQLCQLKLPTKASIAAGTYKLNQERIYTLLFLSFITWTGDTFHRQLTRGEVCCGIKKALHLLLQRQGSETALQKTVNLLKVKDNNVVYSASQALITILPLCHCGQDISIPASEAVLRRMVHDLVASSPSPTSSSLLDLMAPGEVASLDLTPPPQAPPSPPPTVPNEDLGYQSWIMVVFSGLLRHGGDGGGGDGDESQDGNPLCVSIPVEEELLCQETQIKCLVIRNIEPYWSQITTNLHNYLRQMGSSSTSPTSPPAQLYLCEGFKVWKFLISVKANLSFVDSRCFTAHLPSSLPLLHATTPGPVWRAVLDTVSECLCYGSTLGLQTVAPEEPCQLAHNLIRLVRFNSFLSRVPHKASTGFGGSAGSGDSAEYDKGLVQKIVLLVLKCVALTVREARCESSSGESDSSMSSHESESSCDDSDMILIERNMMAMYKSLDFWVKAALPILPDQSLQDSALHLLSEQDDVLVEGMLCLLDTHVALYMPGKQQQIPGLLNINPTKCFMSFLGIVNHDASVLLDFLVSNETCFLLYILRYLKYVVKDFDGFVRSCDGGYAEVIKVLVDLKASVTKLVKKSLFPYNIQPVCRLLEKVEFLHQKGPASR